MMELKCYEASRPKGIVSFGEIYVGSFAVVTDVAFSAFPGISWSPANGLTC